MLEQGSLVALHWVLALVEQQSRLCLRLQAGRVREMSSVGKGKRVMKRTCCQLGEFGVGEGCC